MKTEITVEVTWCNAMPLCCFNYYGLHRNRCFSLLLLHSTNCIDSSPSQSLSVRLQSPIWVWKEPRNPQELQEWQTDHQTSLRPTHNSQKNWDCAVQVVKLQLLSMSNISPCWKQIGMVQLFEDYHWHMTGKLQHWVREWLLMCVLDAELKPWLNLHSLSHTPTSTQCERCSHSERHIIHSFGPWLGYSAALPCCGGDLWYLRIIQQTQDKPFHNLSSLAWRSKAKKGAQELPWRLNESSGVYPLNHMYHTWIRAQPQPGI